MKVLLYTDGKPAAMEALRFGAHLIKRLDVQLSVITVRPGTHASEEPPPIGVELPFSDRSLNTPGIKPLANAAEALAGMGIFPLPEAITIRDMAKGHMFVCKSADDERIPFYEAFGHFTEALNNEVDEHRYDLLIIAPPLRSRLGRLVIGDTPRKLALDLHTSVLFVRGGHCESRYLVCADGSPASHRQFPILRQMLPAIVPPVDLICVQTPDSNESDIETARSCLDRAQQWLGNCGKLGTVTYNEHKSRADAIIEAAGEDSVIIMGASLRHDVYKRMRGSLPMRILDKTVSSVLLAKRPPESDTDFEKMPFECQ